MNCPKCNGNGEIEMTIISEIHDECQKKDVICVYCGGTGYLETIE